MGRPKKDPQEARCEVTQARVTVAEKLHVQQQAKAAGLTEAEYVRRRALGYEVPPARALADQALITEVNRMGWELNRIGQNVDQLLLATYRGSDFVNHWDDIGQEVKAVAGEASGLLDRLVALNGS